MHHIGINSLYLSQNLLDFLQHSIGNIVLHTAGDNQTAQEAVACQHFVELHQILLQTRTHADYRREADTGTNVACIAHMVIQALHLCSQGTD